MVVANLPQSVAILETASQQDQGYGSENLFIAKALTNLWLEIYFSNVLQR